VIRLPVISYAQIVDQVVVGAPVAAMPGTSAGPGATDPHIADLRTTLPIAKLEHHLDWYAINGFQTIDLDELVNAKPDSGATSGTKKVALTFDGGFESHYRLVLPALQKRHMRATFFVPRDMLDKPGGLSRGEIEIMGKWGMGLGILVPPPADVLRMLPPQLGPELSEPRRFMSELTGRQIILAATLARHVDAPFLRTLRAHDYKACALTDMGNHVARDGLFVISRYFHRKSVHMDEWKNVAKLSQASPAKNFFFVRSQ
jgi:hypothetical protein